MPINWKILTMAYLKVLSDDYSVEYSRLRSNLYHNFTWKTSDVQQALNDLVNMGYMTQAFVRQEYIIKGKDEFGNPLRVPPDPSNMDDMERARTIVYTLTPRALDVFRIRVGPSKMGDAKHARVIEKLLKERVLAERVLLRRRLGQTRAWRCPTSPSSSPPPRRSRTSTGTTRGY